MINKIEGLKIVQEAKRGFSITYLDCAPADEKYCDKNDVAYIAISDSRGGIGTWLTPEECVALANYLLNISSGKKEKKND